MSINPQLWSCPDCGHSKTCHSAYGCTIIVPNKSAKCTCSQQHFDRAR